MFKMTLWSPRQVACPPNMHHATLSNLCPPSAAAATRKARIQAGWGRPACQVTGHAREQLIYLPVLNPHASAINNLMENQNVVTVKFLLATVYNTKLHN